MENLRSLDKTRYGTYDKDFKRTGD
ncbi:MAG: hypothetical protein LC101_03925 [Flavobacteriales bacterium]|nr:hypothetical protein [Flavobacteriales bacterium]